MKIFEKGLLASIGLASMTSEKAKKIADDLVKEGQIHKDAGLKFAIKLVEQGEEERSALRKIFQGEIEEVLGKMNLVTKKDFKTLEKKIDKLTPKKLHSN
jgi:polyhydroxyalkanoate synthesis regulator phasin